MNLWGNNDDQTQGQQPPSDQPAPTPTPPATDGGSTPSGEAGQTPDMGANQPGQTPTSSPDMSPPDQGGGETTPTADTTATETEGEQKQGQ